MDLLAVEAGVRRIAVISFIAIVSIFSNTDALDLVAAARTATIGPP
jgi:hypothetical protein